MRSGFFCVILGLHCLCGAGAFVCTPAIRFGTTGLKLHFERREEGRATICVFMNARTQAEGSVVVGGGLAGLAAAVALRNIAGLSDVRVLESTVDAQFRSNRAGAAAQLGPNGLKALRRIGGDAIVSRILEAGTRLQGNIIILPQAPAKEGETDSLQRKEVVIPDATEADTGLPQVLVRWGVLRSILADLLPAESIFTGLGADIVGYRQSAAAIAPIRRDGQTILPPRAVGSPLIVAADGAYSSFRALLRASAPFPGTITLPAGQELAARRADLKYGGRINVKAVVAKPLLESEGFKDGHTYGYFPTGGVACFAGPAGDGYTYWAISIADTNDDTTGEATPFLRRLDVTANPEIVKAALLERLRALQSPREVGFINQLIEATDAEAMYVQRSEEAVTIGPSLASPDGRIVLVGDAAHVMSASYGQAANFAFEDAVTLAACVRDGETLTDALERYSGSRVERCLEMQRRSAERAAKAMKGEPAEDVSKWIFQWEAPN